MTRVHLGSVTYICRDYDEAIAWFASALGWEVTADQAMGGTKRWVVISPSGGGTGLRLARADSDEQRAAVGKAAGGMVGFIAFTENFAAAAARMRAAGVVFLEAPRDESYGIVAVFEDLHGNRWDLIEPR